MDILIYISLHTINIWLLKSLSLESVPTEVTLIIRGLGCIIMSVIFAYKNNFSLLPKDPKLQLTRLFTAGLGLGLMIASYQYVNASTAAVLFKFDVIFLIFISMFLGNKVKTMIYYALGAFAFLLTHIFFFKEFSENILGYITALIGTFIISIGFLLLNKSGQSENQAVTCLVPGISISLFGVLLALKKQGNYFDTLNVSLLMALCSGIIMFAIYIYTLKLYKKYSVVFAEILTFICIILLVPIEIWGLRTSYSLQHLFSILVIASYTLFVYLKKYKSHT